MTGSWIADTLASERYPIYTRANAGEVMPDPVSPLTSSFGIAGPGEQGWRDAYVRGGTMDHDEFEPDRPDCVGIFGGYLYLNLSLIRLYGLRMPGMTPELADVQYLGDMPGITPYAEEARPTDESERHSALMTAWIGELFTRTSLDELAADRDEVDRWVARRPVLEEMTDQELVDQARSFIPLYRRLFCRHIMTSGATGIGLGVLGQVLGAIGRPELAMVLVAGLGEVDSAAPSFALWELGRLVRSSSSLTAAFDAGVSGLGDRLAASAEAGDTEASEFGWRFEQFLRNFGSRGPNEWEFRSHVWGTNPALVLVAIDRMRLAADADSPTARTDTRAVEREAATAEVRAVLADNAEVLATFDSSLRLAQLTAAGRERTKTNSIKVVHEMRLAYRELGRRWVDTGFLDNIEQIFMLTDGEMDDVVEHPERFDGVAAAREATYLALWDVEPPFVSKGAPPDVSTWRKRSAALLTAAAAGTVLTGIAGSPGVATGRARIVLDPADPRGLEPGDVLIAPATDPSWTPLFVPAAAVVVDVGAQITHAVIVSRELGLPCVVSVAGATRSIPDGALVRVDGGAGTVTVVSLP